MFCKQCGKLLSDNAVFCTNCGSHQTNNGYPKDSKLHLDKTVGCFDSTPISSQNDSFVEVPAQESVDPSTQQTTQQSDQQPIPKLQPINAEATSKSISNNGKVRFKEAVILFFKNYKNFDGRASKSEYWWIVLFNLILFFPLGILSAALPPIGGMCTIALIIPGVSLMVRRLHDTGKSGKYSIILLIPIFGAIMFLVQVLKDSDGDNQWGKGTEGGCSGAENVIATNIASVNRAASYNDVAPVLEKTVSVNQNEPHSKIATEVNLSVQQATYQDSHSKPQTNSNNNTKNSISYEKQESPVNNVESCKSGYYCVLCKNPAIGDDECPNCGKILGVYKAKLIYGQTKQDSIGCELRFNDKYLGVRTLTGASSALNSVFVSSTGSATFTNKNSKIITDDFFAFFDYNEMEKIVYPFECKQIKNATAMKFINKDGTDFVVVLEFNGILGMMTIMALVTLLKEKILVEDGSKQRNENICEKPFLNSQTAGKRVCASAAAFVKMNDQQFVAPAIVNSSNTFNK